MEQSISFLDRVADFLLTRFSGEEGLHTLVVLPNRRSQVFLKRALAGRATNVLWLPDMLTIDELMAQLSGLAVVDPLATYLELYKIHRELEKEKARPLDDFLSWAPLMLNDFSDIDFSMARAERLFHELSEAKALEEWNLGEKPLTALQKDYLAFFRNLFRYYERLQMRLLSRQAAYKALAYRVAAEKLQSRDLPFIPWKNFVFVGFNALTEAEQQVVSSLKTHFNLHYFVHADRYYFDPGKKKGHEAGRFLQQVMRKLKVSEPQWVEDLLLNAEKEVMVYGIPGQSSQVKFAGQLIGQWLQMENADPVKMAVVLADERLLVPLLGAIPSKDKKGNPLRYNVTMGYPLRESPFYDLVYRWLQLFVLRESERERSDGKILLPLLQMLLENPLAGLMGIPKLRDFYTVNRLYAVAEEICSAAPEEQTKTLLGLFLKDIDTPFDFMNRLQDFLLKIKVLPVLSEKKYALLRFQLVLMMQVLKLTSNILRDEEQQIGFQGLQKILLQFMGRKEVSLKGEPLAGIQIMGMLETRNLDFDRVLFVGANEGLLPKTGFQESFIPYDLRRAYGLPLQNSKTAVASYHFFRLLQHAHQVALIYNSEPDVLGGGEVSRFVLQIENELARQNPLLRFQHHMAYVPLRDTVRQQEISVAKEPAVMQKLLVLAQRGISPSAINMFVRCPLQFYYRYVAGIEAPLQPELSVQSNTFGSVVHDVLDALYQPYTGKPIDGRKLRQVTEQNLDRLLQEAFRKIYGDHDMQRGRNILIYKVARRYVERFVKNDTLFLKQEPRVLVATEKDVKAPINCNGRTVMLKGFIDRIDRRHPDQGQVVRIIDYKTGTVKPEELKLKTWESVRDEVKFAKALQVMMYSWIFKKNFPQYEVVPGIISLKSSHSRFMPVVLPAYADGRGEDDMENVLKQLINRIMDEREPFRQTENLDVCSYCDFQSLCNR